MTKTRDLANLVSGSNPLVDGVIDYSEVTNTPAPFDPATLAAVAVSGAYADLGGKPALATVATSGSFTDLSNQPTPFDPATLAAVATTGAYADVTGTPTLAAVATSGAYSSLSGTPALAAVATSGAYSSLSGTPAAALPLTGGTLSGTLTLNGALNGVTSVNATTAASITAAGVGGSTVKLIDNVAITSSSSLTISFSATYSQYRIMMSDVWSTINNDSFFARLTDSSGTLITGGVYDYYGLFATAATTTANTGSLRLYGTGLQNETDARLRGMDMTVMEPWATDAYTYVNAVILTNNSSQIVSGALMGGGNKTIARNNSIVIQFGSGNFQARGRYSVWGIK